ncbi:CsbD family protein [Granulibacter bethesdensis]|uniref:CsbD family protein n=1 Tax=Granulibacter bethesdensis TaxID=364410 RepID=UPI0009BDEC65|nr:CsbD family protein [Granulibacter bethesdensis]
MGNRDIDAAVTDLKGKVKDAAGGLTGDTGLQAEGKLDQGISKAKQFAHDATDAVQDGVEHLRDKANSAEEHARQHAESVTARLRDLAETAWEKAADAGGKVYESGVRGGQKLGESLEQKPVLSVALAGVVGYLAAFMIHSPSSPLAPEPPPKRRWPF